MHTRILALALLLLVIAGPLSAQTISNTTTLSGALDASQTTFNVGSTTNIQAGYFLFVPRTGEAMRVLAVPVSGTVRVARAYRSRPYAAATSSDVIIFISPDGLVDYDPSGACTRGSGLARFSPLVNVSSGRVWVCRSSLWQGTTQTLITHNSLAPFTP